MALLNNQFPIQPIETRYKGYRFRSRLEARWAVFFETLGVEFNYEAEGFRLGAIDYLPDFYLPSFYRYGNETGAYFEVKGRKMVPEDELKVSQLAIRSGCPAYVWEGNIPEPDARTFYPGISSDWDTGDNLHLYDGCDVDENGHTYIVGDSGHFFGKCPKCNRFGAFYYCYWGRLCKCFGHERGIYEPAHDLLAAAYAAARSARFEHGERG